MKKILLTALVALAIVCSSNMGWAQSLNQLGSSQYDSIYSVRKTIDPYGIIVGPWMPVMTRGIVGPW